MNKIEKKREYASPVIQTYAFNANTPDFLITSGNDPDQGEWDEQPDWYIIPGNKDNGN